MLNSWSCLIPVQFSFINDNGLINWVKNSYRKPVLIGRVEDTGIYNLTTQFDHIMVFNDERWFTDWEWQSTRNQLVWTGRNGYPVNSLNLTFKITLIICASERLEANFQPLFSTISLTVIISQKNIPSLVQVLHRQLRDWAQQTQTDAIQYDLFAHKITSLTLASVPE